ncbi:MAG: NADH-quinone oxidoreductase subunit C [Desulfonatronovibrionaceae bacterium]
MTAELDLHELIEQCNACTDAGALGCYADLFILPRDLETAAAKLRRADFFIEDINCVHIQEGFLLLYHFDHFDQPGRISLRIIISPDNPEIPSISSIFPGANWHERECFDFFGIRFKGHPNLIPLLLDPEHQGPPPLLKDQKDLKDLYQLSPCRTGKIPPNVQELSEVINQMASSGPQEES